jgi:hypothetical protein
VALSARWKKALAGGGTFLALGIGGLIVNDMINGPTVSRDDATQEFVDEGNADVMTLRVGDCFDNIDATEISQVPVVPCADAHDNEVFHAFALEGDEWPGDAAVQEEALAACDPAFEDFVGVAYDESTLDWSLIFPTEASWNEFDDREVQCVLFDPAGQVEGSLAGAAY